MHFSFCAFSAKSIWEAILSLCLTKTESFSTCRIVLCSFLFSNFPLLAECHLEDTPVVCFLSLLLLAEPSIPLSFFFFFSFETLIAEYSPPHLLFFCPL